MNEGCEYCNGGTPLYNGITHDFGMRIDPPNKLVVFGFQVCGLAQVVYPYILIIALSAVEHWRVSNSQKKHSV